MRKTEIYTVPTPAQDEAPNRDKGRSFLLTEMGSIPYEKFIFRLISALAATDVIEKTEAAAMRAEGAASMVGIVTSMIGKLPFDLAEPLLDEMMTCVEIIPDLRKTDTGTKLPITIPLSMGEEIEELSTLFAIRGRLIELHTGFSVIAALSHFGSVAKDQILRPTITPTSLDPSEA